MKSYKSILLIALFVISIFAVLPVQASSGHPTLGVATTLDTTSTFTGTGLATNISVLAGTNNVLYVGSNATAGYFALNFANTTFDGSTFELFLSTNGYSQISTGDILFTGNFSVDHLLDNAIFNITFSTTGMNGVWPGSTTPTFYYGTTNAGVPEIIVAIPSNITGQAYYVKVYDGSTTSVAVSAEQVAVLASISVSPGISGSAPVPAGTPITVSGFAWAPNQLVNISVYSPNGTVILASITNVTASATGTFSWTFPMPDDGMLVIPQVTTANYASSNLVLAFATLDGKTAISTQLTVNSTVYYIGRSWTLLSTYDNSGVPVAGPGIGPLGSINTPYYLAAKVFGTIYVNASNFNPSGTITAFLDYGTASQRSLSLTFLTSLTSKGIFNATFTVPAVSLGNHLVTFVDASWNWNFTINVLTTLLITPTSGPVGTVVTVTGYGFGPNLNETVYFLGTNLSKLSTPTVNPDNDYVYEGLVNTTTGAFNFTFTIPAHTFGGAHYVYMNSSNTAPSSSFVLFTVTGSWSSPNSTTLALGSNFLANGDGLPSGTATYTSGSVQFPGLTAVTFGAAPEYITAAYDNAQTVNGYWGNGPFGNSTGQLQMTFVAAGVPMVHYIQIFDANTLSQLNLFAITVNGTTVEQTAIIAAITSENASLQASMTALTTTVNGIYTTLSSFSSTTATNFAALTSQLSTLGTSVSGVQSSVTSLTSSVNTGFTSMTAGFTSVNSAISSLSSSQASGFSSLSSSQASGFSSLTTAVSGVNTAVSGVASSVSSLSSSQASGFSSLNNAVSGVSTQVGTLATASSVSTLSGQVSTLSGQVTTLSSTASTINTATSTLSTMMDILYIAIILIAIAVVLEIVVLIRK
ncbi:MAG: hypothetical protein ABSG92_09700 [Conexivisphaerales archaeon]|jgi:hypothetical protein